MGKTKQQYLIDKERLAATGHSIADLIREAERTVNYRRVSGYLTGYWDLNERELKIFYSIIEQWEKAPEVAEVSNG